MPNPVKELIKDKLLFRGQEEEGPFENVKKAVTTAPVLQKYHLDHRALEATDTSANEVVAVLERETDGKKDPWLYISYINKF